MSKFEKLKKVAGDIWLIVSVVTFFLIMVDLFIKPTNHIFKLVTNVLCYSVALVFLIMLAFLVRTCIKNIYKTIKD